MKNQKKTSKKEVKKDLKLRDLKPKKDAKGGLNCCSGIHYATATITAR